MDISTKLTNFISAYTIVTDEFNNSIFGGLWATSSGDAIDAKYEDAGIKHPLTHGHDHRGGHVDGSAQKILLTDGAMIDGVLSHPYLADDAVADRNVQQFVDQTQAIPWYEEIGGVKYYKLDLSMFSGGSGAFEEVPADGLIKHTSTDYDAHTGYDFVFGSDSLNDKAVGTDGDSRFLFDRQLSAFRAGVVDGAQWDVRGHGSTAFGGNNTAGGGWSTIAGGGNGFIDSQSSNNIIGAGDSNRIEHSSTNSAISSGYGNELSNSSTSSISSGYQNDLIKTKSSSVVSGHQNTIVEHTLGTADNNIIGSGRENEIISTIESSVVGGRSNILSPLDDHSGEKGANFIGGGLYNQINSGWDPATTSYSGGMIYMSSILGGQLNKIESTGHADNEIPSSVIAGGYHNIIDNDRAAGEGEGVKVSYAFIGAGVNNKIHMSGEGGTSIVGGAYNLIKGLDAQNSFGICRASIIGAGGQNRIYDSDYSSILSGGDISDNTLANVIVGGSGIDPHTGITVGPSHNSILCGMANIIGDSVNYNYITETGTPTHVARYSSILNGSSNKIIAGGGGAVSEGVNFSTIIGGTGNSIEMSSYSLVPNGNNNSIQHGTHNVLLGHNQTIMKNAHGTALEKSFGIGFTSSVTDAGTDGMTIMAYEATGITASTRTKGLFCIGNGSAADDNSLQFAAGINTIKPFPYHPSGAEHAEGLHVVGPATTGLAKEPTPLRLTNLHAIETFKYLCVDSTADGNVYVVDDAFAPSAASHHVSNDSNPELGGDLNTKGHDVTNDVDEDVRIVPTGNGRVVLKDITFPNTDGNNNQVLKTDGNGDLSWTDLTGSGAVDSINGLTGAVTIDTDDVNEGAAKYYTDARARNSLSAAGDIAYNAATGAFSFSETFTVLSDDGNPHLGANLDVNGHNIVSSSDGNINLLPHGNGVVNIDGSNWPTGLGVADQVLGTNGAGQLAWIANAGGGSLNNVSEDSDPSLGGDLDVSGNSIVSTSNGNIKIAPDGAGAIIFGEPAAGINITTEGTSSLVFNTNEGTNTGSITINEGVDGNISLLPNGAGAVNIDGSNWPTDSGANTQVLQTNGAGQLSWVANAGGGGGINNVSEDSDPSLGGDLDVSGSSIVSTSNGNINISPAGAGHVVLQGQEFPSAAASGGGVLRATDGLGELKWTASDQLFHGVWGAAQDFSLGYYFGPVSYPYHAGPNGAHVIARGLNNPGAQIMLEDSVDWVTGTSWHIRNETDGAMFIKTQSAAHYINEIEGSEHAGYVIPDGALCRIDVEVHGVLGTRFWISQVNGSIINTKVIDLQPLGPNPFVVKPGYAQSSNARGFRATAQEPFFMLSHLSGGGNGGAVQLNGVDDNGHGWEDGQKFNLANNSGGNITVSLANNTHKLNGAINGDIIIANGNVCKVEVSNIGGAIAFWASF
tara:strand:+ start:35351 stop:39604 length:4254 start_codon:yes stop_codon:yes gene_type:complete